VEAPFNMQLESLKLRARRRADSPERFVYR
jgi:hypothetical protein